jgi:hypothetical protein
MGEDDVSTGIEISASAHDRVGERRVCRCAVPLTIAVDDAQHRIHPRSENRMPGELGQTRCKGPEEFRLNPNVGHAIVDVIGVLNVDARTAELVHSVNLFGAPRTDLTR